ncbi:MAG: PaaX domain-containing protein, C- domain protein [Acidimicrobiia bacterium]|nr:PaaX domain-containing protein, C- domain protein [Acidimicrobiia bacterium]
MSRPLSARSIIASTLLGTLPPMLPSRLLVAFTAQFGVSEGATRVALSRMIERGELTKRDGSYALTGPLLDRQQRQEAGLTPAMRPWDGRWELYVLRPGGRRGRDRAALRQAFAHLGLGERREGTWLRPDNLDPRRLPPDREVVHAQADRFVAAADADAQELVGAVFDLEGWSSRTHVLRRHMTDLLDQLDRGDQAALAPGFTVAAAVLRHLVSDPLLPEEIAPTGWPASELRADYAVYDRSYRAVLAGFFADQRRS